MPLDFSDLIPAKPQASGISFDDLIPKKLDAAPAIGEAGTPQPANPPIEPDASQRIGAAAVQGAVEGFGHPIGQTILSDKAQEYLDAKQREGGVGGFLAGLGSTAAEDIGTAGGVIAGAGNALFRGAQGAVAQTGAELGAPELGRDIAAIPEAFMGSPSMLHGVPEPKGGVFPTDRPYVPRSVAEGNILLDYPRTADGTITARQVQARDGVGIMEAWNRAHTENTAASIAAIGSAPDIDGAIAAAGKAASAPATETPPAAGEAAPLTGEALGTGDLWRTDPEQLQTMLGEKGLSDRQKTVQALGGEPAAVEFYRLDRKQNSTDPQRADEGAKEFAAKFGNLTSDQERLIYGVGETDAQADEIKQVLDAHSRISNDPTDAGYEAAIAIRSVPAAEIMAVPGGKASPLAQAAYVRLKNAYGDMLDAGIAPDRVLSNIADALVKRGGWSPGDAAEVVGDFAAEMKRGAETSASPAVQPQIAGPATTNVPIPQSVGAAASRDMTHPSVADISTADMKANRRVAEQAEILRPPQAGDTMIHVPGSFPTLAESSGDPLVSQYENLLRQRNPGEFIGEGKRLTENNNARVAEFDTNTVPDTTLNSMRRDRDARFSAASDDILPTAKPADLTPALDWVQEQLSNPRIQENDAVRSVLENFRDRIVDDGGNLKTDPAAVWGMHDHLQNLLAKAKDPLNATGAEKFAQSQILKMKQLIDQAMNVATDNRFQSALDRYAEDSKAINSGVLFNDFRSKLTNMSGDLQAANFHNFVKGLAKERGDPGIDPSMDISDQGMRSMINIDTDLKRAGLIRLGAAAGSPTNLLGALAEKAGLDAAHSALGAIPGIGGMLSVGQKYLAQRKLVADTARHLAPPEGGYTYPEPDHGMGFTPDPNALRLTPNGFRP
jgi:hypothetical protein